MHLSLNRKLCDSSFQYGKTGVISIQHHIFSSTDFNAMGFSIFTTSASITDLVLHNCTLSKNGVIDFMEKVGSTKLNHINCLGFSTSSGIEQYNILNLLLEKLNSLEYLHLESAGLGSHEIKALTSNITLSCLKVLKIHMPLNEPNVHWFDPVETLKQLSFSTTALKQVEYNYHKSEHESHKISLSHLLKAFQCEIVPLCDVQPSILSNLYVDLSRVPQFLYMSTLILVNCNLADHDIQYLASNKINVIETLRLDFNKLSSLGAKFLSAILKYSTKLARLSASCNQIDNQGASEIADALALNINITELDLQCNLLGDEGAVAIARAVKDYPANFHLLLWNIKVSPEGATKVLEYRNTAQIQEEKPLPSWKFVFLQSPEAISRAIKCCANLITLNFSNRSISSSAIKALAEDLKFCINLQTLNLSGCRVSYKVLKPLGEGLQKCSNLLVLNLGNNKIYSNDAARLVEVLKFCHTLQNLNLHNNEITIEGVETIAYELGNLNMRSLNLYHNKIGKYGAAALARWIRCGMGILKLKKSEIISRHSNLDHFLLKSLNAYSTRFGENKSRSGNKWCTSLEALDVGNNRIGSEGAAALAYGLKYCSELKSLNLLKNEIGEYYAAAIGDGLKKCGKLQTLILNDNPLQPTGSATILSALKACHNLRVLRCARISLCINFASKHELMSHDRLQAQNLDINLSGIIALAQSLKCWNHLQELNICNNNINSSGAAELANGLKYNKALQILNINDNQIGADGMVCIAQSLKGSQLQCLDLGSNNGKQEGIVALAALIEYCGTIEILDLSSNFFGLVGARALGNAVKSCKNMKKLILSKNDIGPDGAAYLADGLKCCSNLQVLNLNHNKITSEGACLIFDGLKSCTRVKELNLSHNDIGTDGTAAIADWLMYPHGIADASTSEASIDQPKLEELDLGFNNIGPQDAAALAKGLKYCTKLQAFDIQNNNICGGAAQLAEELKACKYLQILIMSRNNIDSKTALELANSLEHCTNLELLDLSFNPGSETPELYIKLQQCILATHCDITIKTCRKPSRRLD